MDVVYYILRAFREEGVTSYEEGIDVVRDMHIIESELMLFVSATSTVSCDYMLIQMYAVAVMLSIGLANL